MPEHADYHIPEWLLKQTFAVQHNPNCPSPFLVRLIGHDKGRLDLKPYTWARQEQLTHDALGFGQSLAAAAEKAQAARLSGKSDVPLGDVTKTHDALAMDPTVVNLSMLVQRLARALRRTAPGDPLSDEAVRFLERNGLTGSPLRSTSGSTTS
jgi:hypothetical protein